MTSQPRTLRPGLHVLEARVEDFDVRAVVVEGPDAVLFWDTLAHPDQMEPARRFLDGRRAVVAYSHADWDHVQGTAALGADLEIIATRACAARFVAEGVRGAPPTRTFEERLSIDLGGLEVRFERLPGHTADGCVAWIPTLGTLLVGDAVETPLPVVNDAAAVAAWVEGLIRWRGEATLDLVVPSHGRVGGASVLDETIGYLSALVAGRAPEAPRDAEPFYRRTHTANLGRFGL